METIKNIGLQLIMRPAQISAPRNVDAKKLQEYYDTYAHLDTSTDMLHHAFELVAERIFEVWLKDQSTGPLNEQQRNWYYRHFLSEHGVRLKEQTLKALRVCVLWQHRGQPSLRQLSREIATSEQTANFCGMLEVNEIHGCSKSSLERLLKLFSTSDYQQLHQTLTASAFSAQHSGQCGLEQPLNAGIAWIDGTCIEADIHFPVDWVLVSDIVRTLLKALIRIRDKGILCRMPEHPKAFISTINNLCIEISRMGGKKKNKTQRKKRIRELRNYLFTVEAHVQSHLAKLLESRDQVDFSEAQIARLVAHIKKYTDQIDPAIAQIKERILQEKKTSTEPKLLSAHIDNVNVVVRGKAGKRVEFGNTLIIAENLNGYITGWQFYAEKAPGEVTQAKDLIKQLQQLEVDTSLCAVVTDRGMSSKSMADFLEDNKIEDFTCRRSPAALAQCLKDPLFAQMQKRRACTEGRIGILKNAKMNGKPRSRSFAARETVVAMTIVCHNLWILASMLIEQRKSVQMAA